MAMQKERTIRRWVLGTVDTDGTRLYLYKKPQRVEYIITPNIEMATKSTSRSTASLILDFYYQDMGMDIQFIPVPINITYELVEE